MMSKSALRSKCAQSMFIGPTGDSHSIPIPTDPRMRRDCKMPALLYFKSVGAPIEPQSVNNFGVIPISSGSPSGILSSAFAVAIQSPPIASPVRLSRGLAPKSSNPRRLLPPS